MYKDGDLDLRSVVTIALLNQLDDQDFETLKPHLGEELQKAVRFTRKLKGKKVKPEKKKKEKKSGGPLGRQALSRRLPQGGGAKGRKRGETPDFPLTAPPPCAILLAPRKGGSFFAPVFLREATTPPPAGRSVGGAGTAPVRSGLLFTQIL